ncbi:hypothetical protein EVA_10163 [gut metagenome]|uniref:Uncharacterized protein n=1 Tax=gut metagenome TaxID=749906 RepID=J9GP54_9ZZZZ
MSASASSVQAGERVFVGWFFGSQGERRILFKSEGIKNITS